MPRRPNGPDPACPVPPARAGARPVSRRALLGSVLAEPASTAVHRIAATPVEDADPDGDAELLRLCAIVQALDDDKTPAQATRWQEALLLVSSLRPVTAAGLRAKARLALALMPFGVTSPTCPDWVNPDERLQWSLLHDVLAWCEPAGQG